jgi:hypothetical protein
MVLAVAERYYDGDLSPSPANIGLEPDGNRFLAGAAPWY